MKILWTDPAIEDLRSLQSYIAKDSGNLCEQLCRRNNPGH